MRYCCLCSLLYVLLYFQVTEELYFEEEVYLSSVGIILSVNVEQYVSVKFIRKSATEIYSLFTEVLVYNVVCRVIFGEAQDSHVETSTIPDLVSSDFFLIPKVNSF